MRDLRLIAVSEDGGWLVLSAEDGEQFRVPRDEQLRAALRGDWPRLGQLQIEMDGELTPRDIQARIRAGMTAEELALATGVPVEKIRRYEGPVLAERAHATEEAQRAAVRGVPAADAGAERTPVPRLLALVQERLSAQGVDVDALAWDAWRRDDGRWQVRLDYHTGSRDKHGLFIYDPARKTVVADDDEARWVVGEATPPAAAAKPASRRLRSVPREQAQRTEAASSQAEGAGYDEAAPDEAAPNELAVNDAAVNKSAVDESASQASAGPGAASEAEAAAEAEAASKQAGPSKRRRRAHVPSWDEIVFGAKKGE